MSTPNDTDQSGPNGGRRHHSESGYRIGVLAAVAGVLLLAVILVNTPWFRAQQRVGWSLSNAESRRDRAESEFPPITRFERVPIVTSGDRPAELEPEAVLADSVREDRDGAPALPMAPVAPGDIVLNTAERMPSVKGGLGNYYLRIDYPRAAIERNIQGRLTLAFYVTRDGEPRDIRLEDQLHPLLDSAAVRALRKTLFIPGRQNGEPVAVRMRLPVRFQLVDRPAAPDSTIPRNELP